MELLSVESSRLVALMTVAQPKEGQPYLPDLIKAVGERYRFQKYPLTYEELLSEVKVFHMGVWDDVQIEEFSVYNDGIIVGARSPTDFLDNFCDDLMKFISAEFGMEKVTASERRHYESAIVARLDRKIVGKLAFLDIVSADLAAFQESYGLGSFEFKPVSIESGVDTTTQTGKRPLSFTIIRRVGIPFEEGVWFSAAPLKTNDHIALLENVEKIMSS